MAKLGVTTGYVLMIIATVLSILFLIVWRRGLKRQENMIAALDEKKYMMKDFYPFGLEVLDLIQYSCTNNFDRRMIGYCSILYGQNYAEYYYRIYLAQIITIPYLLLIGVLIFSVFINELLVLGFGLLAVGGVAYYYHTLIMDIINDRTDSIIRDFPEVLSKLALLVNAGMIMKEAWEKVSTTGDGVLYQEMGNCIDEMQNGASEIEAYLDFSRKCGQNEVNKFTSTLVQNLSKGNKEIVEFLKIYSADSWELRKHEARRKGEEASSKLLIPVGLMFGGLLIMIAVPIMSNISF